MCSAWSGPVRIHGRQRHRPAAGAVRVQPRALETALDLLGSHLWRNRTAEGRMAQSRSPCLLAAHVAGRPLSRRAHEGTVGCLQTGRGTGGRVVDTPRWTRPDGHVPSQRRRGRGSRRMPRSEARAPPRSCAGGGLPAGRLQRRSIPGVWERLQQSSVSRSRPASYSAMPRREGSEKVRRSVSPCLVQRGPYAGRASRGRRSEAAGSEAARSVLRVSRRISAPRLLSAPLGASRRISALHPEAVRRGAAHRQRTASS